MMTPTLLLLASGLCACLLPAQPPGIGPAVVLRLPSAPGRMLRIESPDNPAARDTLKDPIPGRTEPGSRFLPAGVVPLRFRPEGHRPDDFSGPLENLRAARGVPALAAALVRSNRVVAIGFTGVRKQGQAAPVTPDDLWHHGSITKSMTATLAGLLVQEGLVAWTNTLAGAFPDRAGHMHHRWRGVTLSQLLRHRAGAPDSDWLASRGIWDRLWNHPGTAAEQRSYWLGAVTTHAPQTTPDTSYTYSNTGYVLAGLMLEAATGRAWEELVRERLFRPLGMQSAGFGVPATPGHIDQPWGHQWSGGRPTPIQPGHGADNPAGLGPAGTVHCSLPDLMKYVAFHAAEGRDGGLLTAETFLALHTPRPGESYALGWNVTTRPWAGGRVLNHTGSNFQWYTTAWIAPLKEAALVAVTNIGDNTGSTAASTTDAAVAELIRRYLPD